MTTTAAPAATTTDRAAELQGFVRHALRIGADFTLSVKTADEFRAVLTTIGGHNNYSPEDAADVLGEWIGNMMRVRIEHFVSGPALYFELPYWTHQRIDADKWVGMGEKYTPEQRQEMAAELRRLGRALAADEISVRQFPKGGEVDIDWRGAGDNPVEVRLWWD